MSCNIRACKGSVRSSCSIFSRSELIWQYWWTSCFGKGRGNTETCIFDNTETPSKLFAIHNALGQLTNHNTLGQLTNHNTLGQLTNHNTLGQLTNLKTLGQLTNHNALGQLTNHNALGQLTNHNALGRLTNHNALGQLTNLNTFRFSEGGPSSNPELIEPFVSRWG